MFSSIRAKAYLILVILFTTLTVQSILQFMQSGDIRKQMVFLANTQTNIITELHSLQIATIQIQQWLTDISATRGMDGLNDGFDEAEKSVAQFRQAVSQLQELDKHSGINYAELIPTMEVYHQTGVKMANAYIKGGASAGNQIMAEFDAAASTMYGNIDIIAKRVESGQTDAFAEEVHKTQMAEISVIIFGGIYLILLIFVLVGIQRFILKPVNNILNMTENLNQGDGDLTQRLTIKGKHEISALAQGFNTFIASTDDMVSQVTKSVSRLIPMSQELLSSNTEIESASLKQSEHSRAVGESIVQTRESANEVLIFIQQIINSVKNNIAELDDGQQVARETIKGMDQLAGEITLVSEAVMRLSEDSTKIESIIDVINAISEQTNLLALNAAIEAARAGEAGRGFAVVADEVRTLATRTKDATKEVQEMISSIQNGTVNVSEIMEKGMKSSHYSVTQVNQTAEAMHKLAASMAEIDTQAEKIEDETKVQNNHFLSVAKNINEMESQFSQTLEHLENNTSFGEDLNKLSAKLQSLIGKFSVTDSDFSYAMRSKKRNHVDDKK